VKLAYYLLFIAATVLLQIFMIGGIKLLTLMHPVFSRVSGLMHMYCDIMDVLG
jgi:hypothetical protein